MSFLQYSCNVNRPCYENSWQAAWISMLLKIATARLRKSDAAYELAGNDALHCLHYRVIRTSIFTATVYSDQFNL